MSVKSKRCKKCEYKVKFLSTQYSESTVAKYSYVNDPHAFKGYTEKCIAAVTLFSNCWAHSSSGLQGAMHI